MNQKEEDTRNMCGWVLMDTNLSTHILMPVSSNTTAADLKRELGDEHPICFPTIGAIMIKGLMVKRRSYYYHIPDSILVKDIFQGWKRPWVLHVDVTPSNHSDKPYQSEILVAKVSENAESQKPENHITCLKTEDKASERSCMLSEGIEKQFRARVNITEISKKTTNKKHSHEKVEDGINEMCVHVHGEAKDISTQHPSNIQNSKNQGERLTSLLTVETPTISMSEVASVTGLLTRYFPEFDEVKSYDDASSCANGDESGARDLLHNPLKANVNEHDSNLLNYETPQSNARTRPNRFSFTSPVEPSPRASCEKIGKTEVGKRLLMAANNIGISASKKKSPIIFCQSKDRKLLSSLERTLVFELSDSG
ncbi:ubiquitin-protein ligase [Thalictrum thalictroides]|uniref:Ubiquitin-protein ligase n=1 Tax=Thalictrum thalictroides TaxID=46969 RepID=A0A7J6WEC9_THATH|nr:ubiquitin-protein ligase [Thalictrum thalictroides]